MRKSCIFLPKGHCIADATYLKPEWKPGGMVFVAEDKKVWKMDNADDCRQHAADSIGMPAPLTCHQPGAR
jgi:hypothetical protein